MRNGEASTPVDDMMINSIKLMEINKYTLLEKLFGHAFGQSRTISTSQPPVNTDSYKEKDCLSYTQMKGLIGSLKTKAKNQGVNVSLYLFHLLY